MMPDLTICASDGASEPVEGHWVEVHGIDAPKFTAQPVGVWASGPRSNFPVSRRT